jgi:predicted DNA binding CopG/RHH family protein
MKEKKNKKEIPVFKTNKEAEDFVENADLTEFDLSGFKPVKFEFSKKTSTLNMRISDALLAKIKETAAKKGMPYTRYIREVLEMHG